MYNINLFLNNFDLEDSLFYDTQGKRLFSSNYLSKFLVFAQSSWAEWGKGRILNPESTSFSGMIYSTKYVILVIKPQRKNTFS